MGGFSLTLGPQMGGTLIYPAMLVSALLTQILGLFYLIPLCIVGVVGMSQMNNMGMGPWLEELAKKFKTPQDKPNDAPVYYNLSHPVQNGIPLYSTHTL
jgi:hypothetical protein